MASLPESPAEEARDKQPWDAVELREVLHHEQRRHLVLLRDDLLRLGVAAPVVGVDHQAGADGAADHGGIEQSGEEDGPARERDFFQLKIFFSRSFAAFAL